MVVNEKEPPGFIAVCGWLAGVAMGLLGLWWTFVAFFGGTMPVLGIESDGGIVSGLAWLFVVEPILMTLAYWVVVVLLTLVSLPFWRASRESG